MPVTNDSEKFTEFSKLVVKDHQVSVNDSIFGFCKDTSMIAMQCTCYCGCSWDMNGYAVMILKEKNGDYVLFWKTDDYIFGFDFIGGKDFKLSKQLSLYKRGVLEKIQFMYVCIMPINGNGHSDIQFQALINKIDGCFYCNKCPSKCKLSNQKLLISKDDYILIFMKNYLDSYKSKENNIFYCGKQFGMKNSRRVNNRSNIDRAFIDCHKNSNKQTFLNIFLSEPMNIAYKYIVDEKGKNSYTFH